MNLIKISFFYICLLIEGTEEHPVKSVINRVGLQLQKALPEKGFALLVNHGIPEEKVNIQNKIQLSFTLANDW